MASDAIMSSAKIGAVENWAVMTASLRDLLGRVDGVLARATAIKRLKKKMGPNVWCEAAGIARNSVAGWKKKRRDEGVDDLYMGVVQVEKLAEAAHKIGVPDVRAEWLLFGIGQAPEGVAGEMRRRHISDRRMAAVVASLEPGIDTFLPGGLRSALLDGAAARFEETCSYPPGAPEEKIAEDYLAAVRATERLLAKQHNVVLEKRRI
jgi:hypothetical protein